MRISFESQITDGKFWEGLMEINLGFSKLLILKQPLKLKFITKFTFLRHFTWLKNLFSSNKIFIEIFQVRPVIDLATKQIRDDSILPDFINITWHEFDDECESAISAISAFDSYRSKCSHFIIGPACEYSVGKH